MRISTALVGLVLTAGFGNSALATDSIKVGNLTISQAWVRASVPGQTNGAGYLTITNTSDKDDKLSSASSTAAGKVELHEVITEGGNAKMREAGSVVVPANGSVTFAPGGYHLMFLQLVTGFKPDTAVPVTLKFEQAGEVALAFEVKPANYNTDGNSGHQMHGGHDQMSGMKH